MAITITLTPEQEAGLAALVAAGDFASIEEAARAAINESLFANSGHEDANADFMPFDPNLIDIKEGRRLVAEADASGSAIPIEQHRKERAIFLAELAKRKRA